MTISITSTAAVALHDLTGVGSLTITYETGDVLVAISIVKEPDLNALWSGSFAEFGTSDVDTDPIVAFSTPALASSGTSVFQFAHPDGAGPEWMVFVVVLHTDVADHHIELSLFGDTAGHADATTDVVSMATGNTYLFGFGGVVATLADQLGTAADPPSDYVNAPLDHYEEQGDFGDPGSVEPYGHQHLEAFFELEVASVPVDNVDYIRLWTGVTTELMHSYRILVSEVETTDPSAERSDKFEYPHRWPDFYDRFVAGDPAVFELLDLRDQELEEFVRNKPQCYRGLTYTHRWPDMWDPTDLIATAAALDEHDLEFEQNTRDAGVDHRCEFEYPTRWPQIMATFDQRDETIRVLNERDMMLEDRLSSCRCHQNV